MIFKKLFLFCVCFTVIPPSFACQPGGKYRDHYDCKLAKHALRIGPDRNMQKMRAAWEVIQGRRIQQGLKRSHSEMDPILCASQSIAQFNLSSCNQAPRESCCLLYRRHAKPATVFSLFALLLFARYAYAAQQDQVPQDHASDNFGPAFTLAERIRIAQSARFYDGQLFHCDGCIQPVAGYMDTLAAKFQTFESNHETVAPFVIPGTIVGLKALYGAIIGGLETESLVGAGAGAVGGAVKGGIDEAKGALAHECLGGVIDPVVQYGIEHIAPKLMKYDCTLKQESAERLATWIAAGWFLNSYEFKHFAKYMRAVDFNALRSGARLRDLAGKTVTFAELTQTPGKAVLSGIPVAVNEILIHKALLEFHDIPVSGNAFQQAEANVGQHMSAGNPASGVPGNAFQQVTANAGQYMSAGLPTSGVPGNAFQQLIENSGLAQSHIPSSNFAGSGYSGNAFQQLIDNAGLYLQYNGQSNNPSGNVGGNGYGGGNAYQQFTQTPGSYFSGNNPSGGVPGNAFAQMASNPSQHFGGSGNSKH